MYQVKAKILNNKKLKRNYFEIALSAGQIAKTALPGQFVNLKIGKGCEPLLRRPLSIHRAAGASKIVLLYEALGKGTRMLAEKRRGEYLDVIGPLGNGFRTAPACRQGSNHDANKAVTTILVAGGMGTAPLVFLAERLTFPPGTQKNPRPLVLIGARSREDILCRQEFKRFGCEVKISTDDGSGGFKGYVSDLLKNILRAAGREPRTAVYACGPTPLLKEISRLALKHNIPAQLSLESHMACGIGACMGCVIKVKSPRPRDARGFEYRRVCKEGPVFTAQEIVWDA